MDTGAGKIIYILGGGHSGSTLLDLILGSIDEAFSVGELTFLDTYKGLSSKNIYKLASGRLCTCEEQFDECPFWSKIDFDNDENVSKHETLSESLRILVNILNPFEQWLTLRFHTGPNREVYRRILDESRKLKPHVRFIVDSSKDPRRLYELVKDPEIGPDQLTIIHLVRDGRGYVYSFQKPERLEVGRKLRNTLVCLAEWIGVNLLSRRMIRKYKLNAHTLSYDRFTENPTRSLDELGQFLGVDLDGANALTRIESSVYHNVHGNPMRRRKIKAIKRDVSWATEFSPLKRLVLSVALYPFNRRWVYPQN